MQTAAEIEAYRPHKSDAWWGYVFIAPFLLVTAIFLVIPVGYSLWISLHETTLNTLWANPFGTMKYVGLGNFAELLSDPKFWWSIIAMFLYAAIVIPFGITASLLLAIMLHPKLTGYRVLRSAFFLPHVFDVFVVGLIWLLIFNPKGGPLTAILERVGITWFTTNGFVDNPYTVLPSIALAMLLKGMGFGMVLFVTALNNIPESVYEAADIDGAGPWHKLRHITVPLVKPMILFQAVTGLTGVLNAFTEFYALTKATGGPTTQFWGTSVQVARVSGFHMFRYFDSGLYGHAAAMSFLLLIIALMLTAVQFKVLGEKN